MLKSDEYSEKKGFIGGAISRIDDQLIVFGDLNKIDCNERIRKFIENKGLKVIEVKGLGPRMAITVLASCSFNGLIDAIDRENILYLKKIPKIGEKLARQIILDLKGKLEYIGVGISDDEMSTSEELKEVLISLGYKEKEIKVIIDKVDKSLSIEDQVKEALKLLLR